MVKAFYIDTPLGQMLAVADDGALHLLEFVHARKPSKLSLGKTKPIEQIELELKQYFAKKLQKFKTPLLLSGTPFQKQVWEELQKIPFGETCSYAEIAAAIGKPLAFRAVAQANAANRFAIIIPCHRVINQNGALGGYSGGIEKKEGLLKHEARDLFL